MHKAEIHFQIHQLRANLRRACGQRFQSATWRSIPSAIRHSTSHRWGSCKWVVQSKNQVHVAMTLAQLIHAVIVISDTGCRRAAFGRLFSKNCRAGFRPLQTERILNDFEIMSQFTRPIHLVMSDVFTVHSFAPAPLRRLNI